MGKEKKNNVILLTSLRTVEWSILHWIDMEQTGELELYWLYTYLSVQVWLTVEDNNM